MSEPLHPGPHLEADSLNAFLEGVLPEHERLECLAHLAECSHCREIVFLAQEPPAAVAAPSPAPWWQRWFAPIPLLSAAAVFCALTVGAWFYLHRAPVEPVREVAKGEAPTPVAPPPAQPAVKPDAQPQLQPQPKSTTPPRRAADSEKPVGSAIPPAAPSASLSAPVAMPVAPPPPPPAPSLPTQHSGAMVLRSLPPPPAASASAAAVGSVSSNADRLKLRVEHNRGTAGDLSEVAGSVTDSSGAAIAKANVTLRQIAGASSGNTQTDERGQFKIAALPPGRYELQIAAQGFRTASGQIELQAQDLAMVAPVLSVGSVAETVEVMAQTTVGVESAATAKTLSPATGASDLPNNGRSIQALARLTQPAEGVTVARGKLMLKVDSAGALSFSKDAGKHWKAVKPIWTGKVVQLATRAESPTNPEAFQITTDSGSVWLSRDGVHWYPDSPSR